MLRALKFEIIRRAWYNFDIAFRSLRLHVVIPQKTAAGGDKTLSGRGKLVRQHTSRFQR